MKMLVILTALVVLANLVHTHSEMKTWTNPNEPQRHHYHHHHHHYHKHDLILGPYVKRLLKKLFSMSNSSSVPICAENKNAESTETRTREALRSVDTTDFFEPKQIMVVVPSPSGEPTWTLEEVTAAVDETNNKFREVINKAYRTIKMKHSNGDLKDLDIYKLSGPSMLVPLTMTSTKLVGSPSSPDTITEPVPKADDLHSKMSWIWNTEDNNSEPCIIPVPSTKQVDAQDDSDNPPEFIPYVPPTRRKADQDDSEKKKLHVVIPSPVGARTWTAGELMNAVGILDKSDKYKAVLKRAYDIVKQKIYNGELQNFRTIEITMPASEMSKWTAVELENALRSRRSMVNSDETSKELQKNRTEEEILSTVAPDDLLYSTTDHDLIAKAKLKCN